VSIINNNVWCARNLQYASLIEKYFRTNGWSVEGDFVSDLARSRGATSTMRSSSPNRTRGHSLR
jgi:hypothetical protein